MCRLLVANSSWLSGLGTLSGWQIPSEHSRKLDISVLGHWHYSDDGPKESDENWSPIISRVSHIKDVPSTCSLQCWWGSFEGFGRAHPQCPGLSTATRVEGLRGLVWLFDFLNLKSGPLPNQDLITSYSYTFKSRTSDSQILNKPKRDTSCHRFWPKHLLLAQLKSLGHWGQTSRSQECQVLVIGDLHEFQWRDSKGMEAMSDVPIARWRSMTVIWLKVRGW